MIDWEMKARQLADSLRTVSCALGCVAVGGLFLSDAFVAILSWVGLLAFAIAGFVDGKIEP